MSHGVVALAFGTPATLRANAWIAALAIRERLPVHTQEEIPLSSEGDGDVTVLPGKELPTLRIARAAITWAKQRGFTRLSVACAKPHAARVMRDLREAVREEDYYVKLTLLPRVEEPFPWFDKSSTQARTRSWIAFTPRELLLRLMPYALYQRIVE